MNTFPSVSISCGSVFQCVVNTHLVLGYGKIDTVRVLFLFPDHIRIKVKSLRSYAKYIIKPEDVVVLDAVSLPPLPLHFGVRYHV